MNAMYYIFFFIGLIIASYFYSQIILILSFAIPFTKKLERASLLKPQNHIVSSYLIAIMFQLILFGITTVLLVLLTKPETTSFILRGYVGGVIPVIFSINKFGMTFDNVSEYFEKHRQFFWSEFNIPFDRDKEKVLEYITKKLET